MKNKNTLQVLFIEDSVDDVLLIVRELSKEYKVIWQRVETEASLILALEEVWEVVLCDFIMPHLYAQRALDCVRNSKNSQFAPFIVMSGSVDEVVAIDILKKGANDFVVKSNMNRIVLVVQREIRQTKELAAERRLAGIRVNESYEATIEAWGLALELRDKYSSGHTLRVTDLALRLALDMNVSHSQFVDLNRGSLLHDIGKMGIPDLVLLKPDTLTFEEMEIMKQHPKLAYDMLSHIPFLKTAVDIPFCHHERWNGSGYPQGLKGKDNPYSHINPTGTGIPFLARMFAVVDVYDALTSDRPYRPSWEKSRVIAYLLDESGKTFDPHVIEKFVTMIGRG